MDALGCGETGEHTNTREFTLNDARWCPQCGAAVGANARFCGSCGASTDPVENIVLKSKPAAAPAGPGTVPKAGAGAPPSLSATTESIAAQARAAAQSAQARIGDRSPEAAELLAHAKSPGVQAASIAAGLTTLVMVSAGLVLTALPFGESSLIRAQDGGFVGRVFWHAVGTLGATSSLADGTTAVQTMPLIALVGVVAAMAYCTTRQAERTRGMPPLTALVWSIAAAVPFSILVLLCGVAARIGADGEELKPDLASLFFLALLWGTVGALIGRVIAGHRDPTLDAFPATVTAYGPIAGAVLTPFVIAFVCAAALGVAATTLAAVNDVPAFAGVDEDARSKPFAILENGAYVVEHGTHMLSLGTMSRFRGASGLPAVPFPVSDSEELTDAKSFGLFDYRKVLPGLLFALGVVIVLAIPALLAVFAGFSLARRVGALRPGPAALWGLAVGPIWALALTLLALLSNKTSAFPLWGWADIGSTFGFTLLTCAILGAVGAVLSVESTRGAAAAPA